MGSAAYQRAKRAAAKLRRGAEPCTWVRLSVDDITALRALGWSNRRIGRSAHLEHHSVGRALAGERIYWASRERLRRLVQ